MSAEHEDKSELGFQAHLDQLRELVDELGTASINDVGIYGCLLRAALVKSFEFTLLSTSDDSSDRRLRGLAKKLGWSGRQPWPSVWHMAKTEGLEALYQYLYSATSKWVHFSPQVLLRMGWGGSKDDLENHTQWTFTTSNFGKYYNEFNRVYSVFLLLKLMRGPAAEIVPQQAKTSLDGLSHRLDEILRWPEAVTFEELNLDGPNPIIRIALKVAHEGKTDGERSGTNGESV